MTRTGAGATTPPLLGRAVRHEWISAGTSDRAPDWVLKVDRLGKVFGSQDASAIADTGPDLGTSKSPSTGAVVAAWDVSFEVAAGEALGVIGESGSGKSTVMRAIAGDHGASAGSVFLRRSDGRSGRSAEEGGTVDDILTLDGASRRRLRIDQLCRPLGASSMTHG